MFGKRVKELRKDHKLTQSQIADIAGVTKGTVALWEQDARKPSLAVVKKLAAYFGCSVDYLLGKSNQLDTDVLVLDELSAETRMAFAKFLRLDEFGQKQVLDTIENEYVRCVKMATAKVTSVDCFRVWG